MLKCCEGCLTVSQARHVLCNSSSNLCQVRSVAYTSARKCNSDAQSWCQLPYLAVSGPGRQCSGLCIT